MKIKRIGTHDLPLPNRATDGSCGYDLRAAENVIIPPGQTVCVCTGFAIELHERIVALICPRSGMAVKSAVTVINAPGIVDWDYRGEIKVPLINHGNEEFRISLGDRIAQLVLAPVYIPQWIEVNDFSETKRGANGFGSTGQ
ncbi:Deoxyuridine 5'-triphosphate nucleotidohydrolase [Gammaproteobacteria bacterium]